MLFNDDRYAPCHINSFYFITLFFTLCIKKIHNFSLAPINIVHRSSPNFLIFPHIYLAIPIVLPSNITK